MSVFSFSDNTYQAQKIVIIYMATKKGDTGNTGKQNDLIHADNKAGTGQEDTEASIRSKLPNP
jgi:hypothetical protein